MTWSPILGPLISYLVSPRLLIRLYQVRCALRVTPRMPVQVETCSVGQQTAGTPSGKFPNSQQQQQQHQTTTPVEPMAEINHPPGTGASRIFQILYRNEEVTLKDVILFRAHLLGKLIILDRIDDSDWLLRLIDKLFGWNHKYFMMSS